jgi:hypothetical protein
VDIRLKKIGLSDVVLLKPPVPQKGSSDVVLLDPFSLSVDFVLWLAE